MKSMPEKNGMKIAAKTTADAENRHEDHSHDVAVKIVDTKTTAMTCVKIVGTKTIATT